MSTQNAIAEAVVRRGGDNLLALEVNQPALHEEVAHFFAYPTADMVERDETTVENDHGRLERHRHMISHEGDWQGD